MYARQGKCLDRELLFNRLVGKRILDDSNGCAGNRRGRGSATHAYWYAMD